MIESNRDPLEAFRTVPIAPWEGFLPFKSKTSGGGRTLILDEVEGKCFSQPCERLAAIGNGIAVFFADVVVGELIPRKRPRCASRERGAVALTYQGDEVSVGSRLKK